MDVLQGSGNLLERGMLERIGKEDTFREKGFLVNKVYAAGLLPAYFSAETLIGGVLSYPVSCALVGVGTEEQVRIAMERGAEAGEAPLSFEEVLSVLEKTYTPIPCDRCQRCHCPYGTEIHTVFRQYQYYFMGKDYWALRKLQMGIEESAAHCKSCTRMSCLEECPRKIRIPDEMQKVRGLLRLL